MTVTAAPPAPYETTNRLAVVSLALAAFGFLGVTAIAAIVCGHKALTQINHRQGTGAPLVIGALVVGYLYVVAAVVVALGYWYISS